MKTLGWMLGATVLVGAGFLIGNFVISGIKKVVPTTTTTPTTGGTH